MKCQEQFALFTFSGKVELKRKIYLLGKGWIIYLTSGTKKTREKVGVHLRGLSNYENLSILVV